MMSSKCTKHGQKRKSPQSSMDTPRHGAWAAFVCKVMIWTDGLSGSVFGDYQATVLTTRCQLWPPSFWTGMLTVPRL